jgi:hypothetical protein
MIQKVLAAIFQSLGLVGSPVSPIEDAGKL